LIFILFNTYYVQLICKKIYKCNNLIMFITVQNVSHSQSKFYQLTLNFSFISFECNLISIQNINLNIFVIYYLILVYISYFLDTKKILILLIPLPDYLSITLLIFTITYDYYDIQARRKAKWCPSPKCQLAYFHTTHNVIIS